MRETLSLSLRFNQIEPFALLISTLQPSPRATSKTTSLRPSPLPAFRGLSSSHREDTKRSIPRRAQREKRVRFFFFPLACPSHQPKIETSTFRTTKRVLSHAFFLAIAPHEPPIRHPRCVRTDLFSATAHRVGSKKHEWAYNPEGFFFVGKPINIDRRHLFAPSSVSRADIRPRCLHLCSPFSSHHTLNSRKEHRGRSIATGPKKRKALQALGFECLFPSFSREPERAPARVERRSSSRRFKRQTPKREGKKTPTLPLSLFFPVE